MVARLTSLKMNVPVQLYPSHLQYLQLGTSFEWLQVQPSRAVQPTRDRSCEVRSTHDGTVVQRSAL